MVASCRVSRAGTKVPTVPETEVEELADRGPGEQARRGGYGVETHMEEIGETTAVQEGPAPVKDGAWGKGFELGTGVAAVCVQPGGK